jgi:hypothetical protein
MCSVHDAVGQGVYEVYNSSGNPNVDTQNAYWDVNGCQYSGNVTFNSPQYNSLPGWEGQTFSDFTIPKATAPESGQPEDDKEKIPHLKELIMAKPETAEAESALSELYAIIRTDYVEDKLDQKSSFCDFLEGVYGPHKVKKIGKMALRYMIIWKMLDRDFGKFIQLSNAGLKELDGVDRMYVLSDLGFGYTHAGNLEQAGLCLAELKQKYSNEKEMIRLLGEDISDVKWQIENGFLKPMEESEYPGENKSASKNNPSVSLDNYPNPGNPSTMLRFHLPEARHVRLKVYNVLGQEVKTLVNEWKDAGAYSIIWDGKDNHGIEMPSGIYLFILNVDDRTVTKKFTLIK